MPPRGRATTTSVNLLPSDFVGQRVELQGLTARADLNGQVGVAKSYDSARGRLAVALDSGEGAAMSDGFWGSGPPLLVRPAHLRLVELETGAVTAAASDEMLRAKRYVEAAIERAGGGGREARRLRRLLASLFQRQLHCVRMAAAEHASVLSECASRAEVPPALWDALSERQQQARAASAHCDASYRALLSDAIEARDAACWSRSAALGCAFLAAEPDRAAEARQLAGKLVRLHGCPGSRPCHDARVALAVAAAGGAGPVAEQPEVCAPVCAALRAEVWERMVAAEPLRRELLEPGAGGGTW